MSFLSRYLFKSCLSLAIALFSLGVVVSNSAQAQNTALGYQDRIFKQKYIVDNDMPKETLEGYLALFLFTQFNDEVIERKLGGKCVPREVFLLEQPNPFVEHQNPFHKQQFGLSLGCNVQALLYKEASQDKYVTDKQLASIITHYRKNSMVGAIDYKLMDNGEFMRRFKIASDFAERSKRIDYAFTFHEKALSQKILLVSKEERVPFNELYSSWTGFDKHAKSFHDTLSQAEVDYKTKRDKEVAEAELARQRQEEEQRIKREKQLAEAAEAKRIRLEKERQELIEKLDKAYSACIEPRNSSIGDCNFFIDKANPTDNTRLSAVLKARGEVHFQQKRFVEAKIDFQRAASLNQADSFITTRLNEIEVILKLEALNKERISFLELAKKEYVSTVRTSLSQIVDSYNQILAAYKELNRHVQNINSMKNSSRTQSGIERAIERAHGEFEKPLERIKIQSERINSIRKTMHMAEGKVLGYMQEIKALDQKPYFHPDFVNDGMRGEEQHYITQNPFHGEVVKEISYLDKSVQDYLKTIENEAKKPTENQNQQHGLRRNAPQQPMVQMPTPPVQVPRGETPQQLALKQEQVQTVPQAQTLPQVQQAAPQVQASIQPQSLTQSELGQCQVGTQCVITQKSLFCKTLPQMNMVLRAPIGQERKKLLDTFKETGDCVTVDANGVMQVKSPQNEQKVTSVRHPAFGDGFTLWDAFIAENKTTSPQQIAPKQAQAVTTSFKLTCGENVNAGGEGWSREGSLTFKDGQSTFALEPRDKTSANDMITASASLNGTSLTLNFQRIAKSYEHPWRIIFNGQVREETKQLNMRGGLHRVTPQNTQGALQRDCTLVLSSEQPLTLAKAP